MRLALALSIFSITHNIADPVDILIMRVESPSAYDFKSCQHELSGLQFHHAVKGNNGSKSIQTTNQQYNPRSIVLN